MEKNSNPNFKIEIVPGAEDAPLIYIDGVAGITFGASVCKVDFHQVINTNNNSHVENRKVVLRAAIPLNALVELCDNILRNVGANSDDLKKNLDFSNEKMFKTLLQRKASDIVKKNTGEKS